MPTSCSPAASRAERNGARLLGAALLAALPHLAAAAPADDPLWRRTGRCDGADSRVIACARVAVQAQRLQLQSQRLSLTLPDARTLVVQRRRAAPVDGGFVWDGRIAGHPLGRATFAVVAGAVVGDIVTAPGFGYRLRASPAGGHVVEKVDMSAPRRSGEPDSARPGPGERGRATALHVAASPCTDRPDRIDVMVLYTPAAVAASVTENHLRALVQQAVWVTNWSFIDSGVVDASGVLQIDAVHVGLTPYAHDDAGLQETLDTLTTRADPPPARAPPDEQTLDSVHARRDRHRADVVVLVVHQPGRTGGYANAMYEPDVGHAFESKAFAVVLRDGLTATGHDFFAHELGHVMGSNHDKRVASDGARDDSHGRTQPSSGSCAGWWTVMGFAECTDCVPLARWSDPRVHDACGRSFGVVGEADNVSSLNGTRGIVANFRCGARKPAHAWLNGPP